MKSSHCKIYVGLLLTSSLITSCTTKERLPKDQIRDAVYSMFEEGWNRGDIGSFDETVADSVVFHYAGSPPQILTRDQMSEFIIRWREAFPDLNMEIKELLIENDLAATSLSLSGTHMAKWADAEPTGKHVSMALMMFLRFEDGKMVELWEVDDQLGFRRQLGLIP